MRSLRLGAALAIVLLLASPATASAQIQITKAYYDSPETDTGSNSSLNAEYIVIKNTGSRSKSLRGWRLKDEADHVYQFGRFHLRPGKIVRIHTGSGTNDRNDRYWGMSWYVWNNDGDTATLKNRSGTVVDRCRYDGGSRYETC